MKVYNVDNACSILKLKAPVLRKYSALLEDAGYTGIERNSSNARFYTDENIRILRELISYKDSGLMTLNDAAKSIAERINGIDVIEDVTLSNTVHVAQRADIENLQNAVLTLTDHIQKSEERHAKSMEDILNELRHVREELREMKVTQMEMKQLEEVETAEEEVAATIEVKEKPRGIFKRLFGK